MSPKRVVAWHRLDTSGVEYAEIESRPLAIEGEVVCVDEGAPCAVSYRVECDDAGLTSRAVVRAKRGGVLTARALVRHRDGSWTVDGRPVSELHGLADIDISVTPATNTLPIRRLGLAVGQRAEVTAAWVRLPALDVVPLRQAYRRLDHDRYEYESPEHGFKAELTVDDEDVVVTYGLLWARVP